MLRPTLILLALLIPQGLLASEVHVSSSDLIADTASRGASVQTATAVPRSVSIELFTKDGPTTPIRFDVDALRPLRLEVVSPDGTIVRTLASGLWAAGQHELAWYGVDDDDVLVEDGSYALRLTLADDAPAVAVASSSP